LLNKKREETAKKKKKPSTGKRKAPTRRLSGEEQVIPKKTKASREVSRRKGKWGNSTEGKRKNLGEFVRGKRGEKISKRTLLKPSHSLTRRVHKKEGKNPIRKEKKVSNLTKSGTNLGI